MEAMLKDAVGALHAVRSRITTEAMDDLDLAGWCEGIDHWLNSPAIWALRGEPAERRQE